LYFIAAIHKLLFEMLLCIFVHSRHNFHPSVVATTNTIYIQGANGSTTLDDLFIARQILILRNKRTDAGSIKVEFSDYSEKKNKSDGFDYVVFFTKFP